MDGRYAYTSEERPTRLPPETRLRIRRALDRREAARAAQRIGSGISSIDYQAPTSALRSVVSGNATERYGHRQREETDLALEEGVHSLNRAVERLNQASSDLSSLLDSPIPRLGSPGDPSRITQGEVDLIRRRSKRRKLDHDPLAIANKGFSYGHRGQVVPGPLKMEIHCCDGGYYAESLGHVRNYMAENVLRNDKSVYCTERNKCNIVLRHQGETTFCLKKIIVKAPERGFTAPIQEGMIFVSMTADDLLLRTSQYHIRESSTPPPPILPPEPVLSTRAEDALQAVRAMREGRPVELRRLPPVITRNENRPPSRRGETSMEEHGQAFHPTVTRSYPLTPTPRIDDNFEAHPFRLIDIGDISTPPPRTGAIPTPPPFDVTTDGSDQSIDEEEQSSPATLADLYHRDQRMPPPYDTSDEDDYAPARSRDMGRRPESPRRNKRRLTPSRIEVTVPCKDSTDEQKSKNAPDILAPHAMFFIRKEKSTISIKFDPPVSGRYILLKLWSPSANQNIDIQTIGVYGFAGPRFFPAVKPL